MLNTTKEFPNEWRDIVYAFLERLSVVKTSVFSKLICLLLFSHFMLHAKSLQSCLTLFDPMDCSLTGSSVHGILQARRLEWGAMPSRGSSQPSNLTRRLISPALASGFFTTSSTWEAWILTYWQSLRFRHLRCGEKSVSPLFYSWLSVQEKT